MEIDASIPALQGQRTLAAIVFSDVVNFSGRMSLNEEHTLKLVQRDMELMTRLCQQYEGKVLKSTGDGLLMYFTSAVQAVACAQEIQQAIATTAAGLSEMDVLKHRIGIHLGDVFVSPTDVMGDGVNIAARLQEEAEPGGICISQIVYDVVKKRLALKATYLGPRELKHIQEAVPIYQIVLAAQETANSNNELHDLPIMQSIKDQSVNLTPGKPQDFPDGLKQQLGLLLAETIGPIAPLVLKQTLAETVTPQDLVERLANRLPVQQRSQFCQKADVVLKQLISPPVVSPQALATNTASFHLTSTNTTQALAPNFIKCCEIELAKFVGPIAALLVQKALRQHSQLTREQLVQSLAKHISNPEQAEVFCQALISLP